MISLTGCFLPQFAYGLPGSIPPVQDFDPLGFSTKADEDTVKRYRECEIMHGKSCQAKSQKEHS